MNKENKKRAKEQRAAERQKAAKRKQITDALWLWIPIVLIAGVLVLMIFAIATSGADSGDGADDDIYMDNGDNGLEFGDWTEVDEGGELDTTEGVVVKEGDTVNIDYLGKVDGVAFDGGAFNGYSLTLGSGEFIDGFEDAIIGHKVGETFDLTVTFPEVYENDPELAGKEAVFTTTINGVYE